MTAKVVPAEVVPTLVEETWRSLFPREEQPVRCDLHAEPWVILDGPRVRIVVRHDWGTQIAERGLSTHDAHFALAANPVGATEDGRLVLDLLVVKCQEGCYTQEWIKVVGSGTTWVTEDDPDIFFAAPKLILADWLQDRGSGEADRVRDYQHTEWPTWSSDTLQSVPYYSDTPCRQCGGQYVELVRYVDDERGEGDRYLHGTLASFSAEDDIDGQWQCDTCRRDFTREDQWYLVADDGSWSGPYHKHEAHTILEQREPLEAPEEEDEDDEDVEDNDNDNDNEGDGDDLDDDDLDDDDDDLDDGESPV